MGKLAELERLAVTDEEMRVQEQVMLTVFQGASTEIQTFMATPQGQDTVRREVLTRKARERLVAIAQGEAPEIEPDEPDEPEGAPEETPAEEIGETEEAPTEEIEETEETSETVEDELA